jgi:hypothetical protein
MDDAINLIPELHTEEIQPTKEAMDICNSLELLVDLDTRKQLALSIDVLVSRRVAMAVQQMTLGVVEAANKAVTKILEPYAASSLLDSPE